jgi:ABC-type multidrug transport system fused ATPase/permease subunit
VGKQIQIASNWPERGDISFKNVQIRYRPGSDGSKVVLDDISFDIKAGEKIGVVGRTGAGKSTLCLALSRILETEKGKIEIDGINTANINIDILRGKLTVIPQEPIIFQETIKFNLDPSGTIPD